MAININIPDQGAGTENWKSLFLTGDDKAKNFLNESHPNKVASDFVSSLLIIATIAAIVYLILSSWTLVTSGGDETKYTKAKTGVINAIIGIVILVLLYGLITVVGDVAQRGTAGLAR